jgi:hypothetical protein
VRLTFLTYLIFVLLLIKQKQRPTMYGILELSLQLLNSFNPANLGTYFWSTKWMKVFEAQLLLMLRRSLQSSDTTSGGA